MQKSHFNLFGQKENIAKLEMYLQAYKNGGIFPNLFLKGAKGLGKSALAKEIGRNLYLVDKAKDKKKVFIEILGSQISTIDDLMNRVFYIHEHAVIFIEEAHTLKKSIITFLLQALQPNKNNYNDVNIGSTTFRVDFRKLVFIIATTETNQIFGPLADRFESLELIDYTLQELASIINQNISPDCKIEPEIILELASYARGNGRSAFRLADKGVNSYLSAKNKKTFDKKDLDALIITLDLFPRGISRFEANVLNILGQVESSSLNALCSKTGLGRAAMTQVESQLMKHNLLEIVGNRRITWAGRRYLEEIKPRLVNN